MAREKWEGCVPPDCQRADPKRCIWGSAEGLIPPGTNPGHCTQTGETFEAATSLAVPVCCGPEKTSSQPPGVEHILSMHAD